MVAYGSQGETEFIIRTLLLGLSWPLWFEDVSEPCYCIFFLTKSLAVVVGLIKNYSNGVSYTSKMFQSLAVLVGLINRGTLCNVLLGESETERERERSAPLELISDIILCSLLSARFFRARQRERERWRGEQMRNMITCSRLF